MVGVEDVQGGSQGFLTVLTPLLLGLGDSRLQRFSGIGDHVLQAVPILQLLGPD